MRAKTLLAQLWCAGADLISHAALAGDLRRKKSETGVVQARLSWAMLAQPLARRLISDRPKVATCSYAPC